MPTTLSSGAVLVGQADGNVTLALLLTAGNRSAVPLILYPLETGCLPLSYSGNPGGQ